MLWRTFCLPMTDEVMICSLFSMKIKDLPFDKEQPFMTNCPSTMTRDRIPHPEYLSAWLFWTHSHTQHNRPFCFSHSRSLLNWQRQWFCFCAIFFVDTKKKKWFVTTNFVRKQIIISKRSLWFWIKCVVCVYLRCDVRLKFKVCKI